ncbi:NADP-dependent oxidoreductase [Dryocola sp. BD586]|uniref:NADP-dependent oxidoreductase n=1 Tax=Dryocola sp. BD586 TaxID=3133271 RepID=UPI003F505669
MKAVRYSEYGGPEVMYITDIAMPAPQAGEIRITVSAAGVNPSDWKRRAGMYRDFDEVEFPAGLGVEASGIVDQLGAGVQGVLPGDAVFGLGRNTAAEYAILTHWVHKPAQMSFEAAGSISVVTETALRSLDDLQLKPGETLFVSGAAGGIGTAVVQIARSRGINVIGSASLKNHDYLRRLGATPTTYGPGLRERVCKLAPQGVDAALDVAGSGIIPQLIAIAGIPSRVVSVADFSAEQYGARFSKGPPEDPDGVLTEINRLFRDERYAIPVEKTYPLEKTAEAHEVSAGGHVTGKLVIVPAK